jgi:predicted Ser/Thr protein kinase
MSSLQVLRYHSIEQAPIACGQHLYAHFMCLGDDFWWSVSWYEEFIGQKCGNSSSEQFGQSEVQNSFEPKKMSTLMEEANRGANEAAESLWRAEEELREWKAANQPLDTTHLTYVELKAEVARCRSVLLGAEQTLQALALQNARISAHSMAERRVTMHQGEVQNSFEMSTLMEEANRGANEARESLRRAEDRLDAYMDTNPQDFTSPGFLALSAEVARCRSVLLGAEQTLQQALALQNARISAHSMAERRVTMHEYLQSIPPLPKYSSTLPGPSSTLPRNVRHPQLTLHWESFQRDTLNYIETDILHLTNLTNRAVFPFPLIVNNELPTLQICIAQNLFDVVAKHMGCTILATTTGETVGNPDGYIVVDASKSISVVYEIKGKWTLNPEWFENDRIDMFVGEALELDASHCFIRNAVNQIYTYMVWNDLQFGILSSFDYTFFLKRCKVENAGDEFEQLLISTGIAHNATNPTVLQSIAYFLSLADGAPFTSPPRSQLRQFPRNSRPSSARNSAETTNLTSDNDHDSASIQEDSTAPNESDFALEDFHIKSILGYGRTKVYYDAKNQLALKAIDLWKQPNMLSELQHEIQIYGMLEDLQGKCIPRVVLHGYWEGGLYCIGFSLCGAVPTTLSESQKQSVLSTLDAVHNRGIIHNDIRKENLLVDENGTVYLIDFGFATLDSCRETQQIERWQLLRCIEGL